MDRAGFSLPVRVYYEDTDAAGVVYYANYLRYFERARTEWLAALGHPLGRIEAEHGIVFVVRRVEVDYRLPARLYDALEATVDVESLKAATIDVRQEARRGAQTLAAARVMLACVDRERFKPARIPSALAAAMRRPSRGPD